MEVKAIMIIVDYLQNDTKCSIALKLQNLINSIVEKMIGINYQSRSKRLEKTTDSQIKQEAETFLRSLMTFGKIK